VVQEEEREREARDTNTKKIRKDIKHANQNVNGLKKAYLTIFVKI